MVRQTPLTLLWSDGLFVKVPVLFLESAEIGPPTFGRQATHAGQPSEFPWVLAFGANVDQPNVHTQWPAHGISWYGRWWFS